jgi:hypothetical protein
MIKLNAPTELRSTLATMKSAKDKGVNMNIWDNDIKAVEEAVETIEALRALPAQGATDNTCYLERSAVRAILVQGGNGMALHHVDALPIFTKANLVGAPAEQPAQGCSACGDVLAILDEIEVNDDGMCAWTEIANAQEKIKAAQRHSAPLAEGPTGNSDVLEATKKLLLKAAIGSCDCGCKSGELLWHAPSCRYPTIMMALENVEIAAASRSTPAAKGGEVASIPAHVEEPINLRTAAEIEQERLARKRADRHSPAASYDVKLEARPAEGGDWTEIYPAQLNWVVKQGHDVRATETARSSQPETSKLSDAEYVKLANAQLARCMDENQTLLAQVEHWKKAYEEARDLAKLSITSTNRQTTEDK